MMLFNAIILCLFASIQVAIAATSTSTFSSCTTVSSTKSVAVVKTITTRRGDYFYASNSFTRPPPTTITVTLPAKSTIFTTTKTTVPAPLVARATDPVLIGVDEASKKPRTLPDDASRGISLPRVVPNRFNFRSLTPKPMYPYVVYCVYEITRVSISTVTGAQQTVKKTVTPKYTTSTVTETVTV
ncbi:uncharacterized protein EAE98_006207 [Botrytis deweyae]|uniref:Yeast cell wall synthesis Kre9/Knh1 C-terminal domain-containing protein n=1 Tax=Botrytis deweyae TaxID=2478750 RepID=A0ABQ7IKA5_9HELO|nr:uncharacterized protein EAE98_006207 [Botrytis deweyae]KAF7926822.1 hypothetical protein EAE98_006207 [Botrytis deweyae]